MKQKIVKALVGWLLAKPTRLRAWLETQGLIVADRSALIRTHDEMMAMRRFLLGLNQRQTPTAKVPLSRRKLIAGNVRQLQALASVPR